MPLNIVLSLVMKISVELKKKRNSKESVKKSTRHLKIALQTVLLRERKDKISSFDPSYKNKMINELIQEQHDKQSISCHECIH